MAKEPRDPKDDYPMLCYAAGCMRGMLQRLKGVIPDEDDWPALAQAIQDFELCTRNVEKQTGLFSDAPETPPTE